MRVDEPLWLMVATASTAVHLVRGSVAGLARAGAAVGQRAGRYLDSQLDRVASSRPVNAIVDAQLDRLLEPLIDRAMPVVLDRLGQRREQVRAIVWEHGEDLTGELVAGIRDRAAAADTVAEQLTRRTFGGRRGVRR